MTPTFTILTPVRNRITSLDRTLHSVVNQLSQNWELLIIDGHSDDGSFELARKYSLMDPRIRLFQQQPEGVYQALNFGIQQARGRYIVTLHSDDVLYDEKVLEIIDQFVMNFNSNLIYGDIIYKSVKSNSLTYQRTGFFSEIGLNNGTWCCPHMGLIVKTKILKEMVFDVNLSLAADFKLIWDLRNVFGSSSSYIPSPIVIAETGGMSGSSLTARIVAFKQEMIVRGVSTRGIVAALRKRLSKLKRVFLN